MAIKYYLGGPGVGKSLFAMREDIIESFFTGRKIITNINGIAERIENTSVYLKGYHKKHKNKKIKEIQAEIKEIEKEKRSLTVLEQDIIDEKEREIETKLNLISFLNDPDYSTDSLLEKLIFVENENNEFQNIDERILNGGVISIVKDFLDENGDIKPEYQDAIIIIDEAKKFFSRDMVKKFDQQLTYNYNIFIGEHRHFGFDIVFIDQEFWKTIDELIKFRVQTCYSLHDSQLVGIKDGYFATIYTLVDPAQSTFAKAFVKAKTINGRYDKDLFKCYRSVRAGSRNKNYFDKKTVPFFKNIKNIIIMFIILISVMVAAGFWVKEKVFSVRSKVAPVPQVSKVETIKPSNQSNSNIVKKTVSTEPEKIDYYSSSKHPVFELIRNNNGYCNGSYSTNDYSFNYEEKFNAFTKKYKKVFKEVFLSDDYSKKTNQIHLLKVVDDAGKILFLSDTKKLAEYYHLDIQIIDNCYYKIKHVDKVLTIYPFEPHTIPDNSENTSSDQ